MKNTARFLYALCLLLFVGSFLHTVSAHSPPPVAKDLDFTTFRNVPLIERFSAVEPEGGAVTFEIVTQPRRGTAVSNEDGTFIYTPRERFRGKDSFSYVAVDACGNVSPAATVRINVIKPDKR